MKLKTRILLFAGITLVCLITGIYSYSSWFLMKSFSDLEREDALDDIQRAEMGFAQMSTDLHVKTVDWASWDNSYKFMLDRNSAFINSNLVDSSIKAMQIDVISYIDLQGKLFCSKPVKRLAKIEAPSPADILAKVGVERILASQSSDSSGLHGLILLKECPMLFSVRPVFSTKGKGPCRGWVLFGRYFDSSALKDLALRTRTNIQIWDRKSKELPQDVRLALINIKSSSTSLIRPMNSELVAGYNQLFDSEGKPLLVIRVAKQRLIYNQGILSVQYLMQFILFATFVFSGMILATLEFFIFSRLSKLTTQVKNIGVNSEQSHVYLQGNDELKLLADTINGMLMTLDATSEDLRGSEMKLREYNENLERTVHERTEQIEHQAFHDALTGLPNRALFMDRLQLAQAKAQRTQSPISVIFIDLDNFKMVNDTLGHEAGDQLLKSIADLILPCVRIGDTVARLGGDEFTILLEEVSSVEIAIGVAKKVLDALSFAICVANQEIFASASLGIAFQDREFEACDSLLRNADTAMYEAKTTGKSDYLLFDPKMNDRIAGRLIIETGLHEALEQGQFFLNYQPLVSLDSNHMIGVEALLRWNHPTLGLVMPGKFISIAEDTGMIVQIGYWVLEEACRQMKAWEDEHPEYGDFTMNVNLSGKQLLRADVVDRVRMALEKTGIDPSHIKLEITESVMMTDMETTTERLHGLKALGVKLAMDDFGTGYSCMANMTSFPLDTIKIDRAFIQRLSNDEANSKHMVEAIIALSKALLLDVTGEGVETLQQVLYLKSLGCDIAQGYYFAEPLTPDEMVSFLAGGRGSLAESCDILVQQPPKLRMLAA